MLYREIMNKLDANLKKKTQSFSQETKSWQRYVRYHKEANGNFRSEKYYQQK